MSPSATGVPAPPAPADQRPALPTGPRGPRRWVSQALALGRSRLGVLLSAQLLGTTLQAAAGLLLAVAVGPEGRGYVSQRTAVPVALAVLANVGLVYPAAFYAKRAGAARATFVLCGALNAMASVVLSAAMVVTVLLLDERLFPGEARWQIALALATIPFIVRATYLLQLLQGLGFDRTFRRLTIVHPVLLTVLWAGAWRLGALSATNAVLIWGAAYLVQLGLSEVAWAGHRRRMLTRETRLLPAQRPRVLITFAGRAYGAQLMQHVVYRLDIIVVAALLPAAEVGLYAFASSAAELAWMPAIAFGQYQWSTTIERGAHAIRKPLLSGLAASAVAAAGVAVASALFLNRVMPDFLAALPVILILLPGIVLATGFRVVYNSFIGMNQPGAAFALAGSGAVIALALYPTMTAHFGLTGAAGASTTIYCAECAIALLLFHRLGGRAPRTEDQLASVGG
jgi:O-antigen/teichoic acid export membrane protein